MNPNGCLARCLRALVTVCGLGLGPSVLSAQRALVYCPVGIDPTGCTTLVQSLGDSGGPFAQRVDMGYDGTDGTIDLASADLSPYAVFIVPALADNADPKPYDRLRTATVASRLRNVLLGRIAVWSGTPDQGTMSRTEKNTLVRNLAVWGAATYATSGLRGLVVLQDYSDSLAQRYGWVAEISRLAVAADSAPGIYNEVQALTATATQLLNNGGQQLAYTDMASFGIEPPGDSSSATADARGGTSGSQVVLVSSLGHGNGAATVKTDQADYAPGQVVTITGSGWQFGEVVSLVLHEDPAIDTHPTLTATADASGHILNNQFVPDVHDVGVRFYLTATGQTSGSVALGTFTDDNFSVGAVSPASGPTLGGTPVTITGTSFTNGRQPFTVSFGTGAPVSATRADNQTLAATTPTHTAGTVGVLDDGSELPGGGADLHRGAHRALYGGGDGPGRPQRGGHAGHLHEQHERRHGECQRDVWWGREPLGQHRHGQLLDRPGRLDHHGELPGGAVHVYRLGPDALLGDGDRGRGLEPHAHAELQRQHERRHGHGQLHVPRGREPHREQRLEDLYNRQGRLDHDGHRGLVHLRRQSARGHSRGQWGGDGHHPDRGVQLQRLLHHCAHYGAAGGELHRASGLRGRHQPRAQLRHRRGHHH